MSHNSHKLNSATQSKTNQTATPQNPPPLKSATDTLIGSSVSSFDKMSGESSKTAPVDYAALGKEIGETLTAANELPIAKVKQYRAAIYNLFPGVPQATVDFGIAAYFVLNDPSVKADWGSAHDITIGGKSVAATKVVGDIISISKGDGELRKFLSTAYEGLVPTVIDNVPGVADKLQARAMDRGLGGVAPIAAVSWVRGTSSKTLANGPARALFKYRSLAAPGTVVNQDVGPVNVMPTHTHAAPEAPVSQQRFF
jgi:hypothetical protein